MEGFPARAREECAPSCLGGGKRVANYGADAGHIRKL
jgi:hypothetical protein